MPLQEGHGCNSAPRSLGDRPRGNDALDMEAVQSGKVIIRIPYLHISRLWSKLHIDNAVNVSSFTQADKVEDQKKKMYDYA